MSEQEQLLDALIRLVDVFSELPAGVDKPSPIDDNLWDVARDAIRRALRL